MNFLSAKLESSSLGSGILFFRADIKDSYCYFFRHFLARDAGNQPYTEFPFAVRYGNPCRSSVGHYYLVCLVSGVESQYQRIRTYLTVPSDIDKFSFLCRLPVCFQF